MTFKLSPEEARLRALDLAENLLSATDVGDWSWTCGPALPDRLDPRLEGRKVPRRWIVSVRWSQGGSILDGPGAISVDVERGTAEWVQE